MNKCKFKIIIKEKDKVIKEINYSLQKFEDLLTNEYISFLKNVWEI